MWQAKRDLERVVEDFARRGNDEINVNKIVKQ